MRGRASSLRARVERTSERTCDLLCRRECVVLGQGKGRAENPTSVSADTTEISDCWYLEHIGEAGPGRREEGRLGWLVEGRGGKGVREARGCRDTKIAGAKEARGCSRHCEGGLQSIGTRIMAAGSTAE